MSNSTKSRKRMARARTQERSHDGTFKSKNRMPSRIRDTRTGRYQHTSKYVREGKVTAEKYLKATFSRETAAAESINTLPPNAGKFPVQPVWSFSGILSSIAKAYRNPDEAITDSIPNARYMRNDVAIMESVEARQRATALLNWHIQPEDKGSPNQMLAARKLEQLMRRIPFFKRLRNTMLEALWYGRYGVSLEWGWQYIDNQRMLNIVDWKPVNGDKLVFRFNDGSGLFTGKEIGIRVGQQFAKDAENQTMFLQRGLRGRIDSASGGRVEATDVGLAYFLTSVERESLVIHKHIIEDGEWEFPRRAGALHGIGIRSRIYWTWFMAQEAMALLMEYLEKVGLGLWVYYYPAGNAEAKAQQEENARNQQQDKTLIMPRLPGDPSFDAYGVEHIEPNPSGAIMIKEIITEMFMDRIKRYILGQKLSTEADGTGLGSRGISDFQRTSFFQIVQSDAIDLEESITAEILNRLIKYNCPEFVSAGMRFVIDTESPDSESVMQGFEAAYNMGMEIKVEDIHDVLGTSRPQSTDETLSLAKTAKDTGAGGMVNSFANDPRRDAGGRFQTKTGEGVDEGQA